MNNGLWWNIKDLNLEPTGYEPDALTNCANVPSIPFLFYHFLIRLSRMLLEAITKNIFANIFQIYA